MFVFVDETGNHFLVVSLQVRPMDKTLEGVQLVHRLIVSLTLIMAVLICSTPRPSTVYKDAIGELEQLQEILGEMESHRKIGYEAVYKHSTLRQAVLEWLSLHNAKQSEIEIVTRDAAGIPAPDPNVDPHVTIEQEVRWVDEAYSNIYLPFVLCDASKTDIFASLDAIFKGNAAPTIETIVVLIESPSSKPTLKGPWVCSLLLQLEKKYEPISTIETLHWDIATHALEITGIAPGPEWVDLDAAGWLKERGLGDFEERRTALLPAIRQLWPDVRTHDNSEVQEFLAQKHQSQEAAANQKIEILGQPLNGAISLMFTSILMFLILVYFIAMLDHLGNNIEGNTKAILECPLVGFLASNTGKVVLICSIVFFPIIAQFSALILVFPIYTEQWPGR